MLQGLGTSTAKEGRKYFEDIDDHQKDFIWVDDQDGNDIELAFSKKRIADRKQWLTNFQVCSCCLAFVRSLPWVVYSGSGLMGKPNFSLEHTLTKVRNK